MSVQRLVTLPLSFAKRVVLPVALPTSESKFFFCEERELNHVML